MKVIRKEKKLEAFEIEEFEKIEKQITSNLKIESKEPFLNFEFKEYNVKRNEWGDYIFTKKNFIPFHWYKSLILLIDENNELSTVTKKQFKEEYILNK